MQNSTKLEELDFRMVSAAAICLIISVLLKLTNFSYLYNTLVAIIATLFCTQYTKKESFISARTRILVIGIGSVLGLIVIGLDTLIKNQFVFFLMVLAGILITLRICKATKVFYIHSKIGCVGFLVTTLALSGTVRFSYGISLIVSTLIGAIISVVVTSIWCIFNKETASNEVTPQM